MIEALILVCWLVVPDDNNVEREHLIGFHNVRMVKDMGNYRRIYFVDGNSQDTSMTSDQLATEISENC